MLLHADWLTYATGEPKGREDRYGNPSPYFRKGFAAPARVRRATLHIAVLGVCKLYLNGEALTDEFLSPPWVDYSKKIPLLSYDITGRLRENNAVGVVLGDGWAVGHLGSTATFRRCGYSDTVRFAAEIVIIGEDGTRVTIPTDETWRARAGEIRRSDIYMGEYIDHRLSLGAFSSPDYCDDGWDHASADRFKFSRNLYLDRIDLPPVRVKQTFRPTLLREGDGHALYDIGQNIAGVLRVTLRGTRGATVVARHAEILSDDGALYTENLRKAEATDTFILSGEGEETFRPLFTYHGFRYAELSVTDGEAQILSVTAEAMWTDLDEAGDFTCSSPLVNRIAENVLWSQRGNFYSVPTDCPQRDERLGWTGDAQVFCQSAMYRMDCRAYYRKYLADIRDAQLGNGAIPCVAPLPRVGYDAYTGYDAAAGWSEAIVVIPYLHYKMYGDPAVVRENLHAAKELLRYYENDSCGGIREGKDSRYGDWLNVSDVTDLDVIATLWYAHAADLLSRLCRIVGDGEEMRYRRLYESIREAFRRTFVAADGRIRSDTQTAYVLGYRFGMISADEAREHLLRKLRERDGHLSTGFLGIRYLLPVLCDIGLVAEAYDILTQEDYPGWGYSVTHGATTIWEHWDSDRADALKGMNSFNHYSLGSCVEWMFEYCLGLSPDAETGGLRRITLRPYLDTTARLTGAHGSYRSPFGRIDLGWEREEDGYCYEASVPDGITVAWDFPHMRVVSHRQEGTRHVFLLECV